MAKRKGLRRDRIRKGIAKKVKNKASLIVFKGRQRSKSFKIHLSVSQLWTAYLFQRKPGLLTKRKRINFERWLVPHRRNRENPKIAKKGPLDAHLPSIADILPLDFFYLSPVTPQLIPLHSLFLHLKYLKPRVVKPQWRFLRQLILKHLIPE
jgi:hypothetical protein